MKALKTSGFLNWLTLFASSGTLICCALPSLLVALGMGAAMGGLVTQFPQLIWLSQYKEVVFSVSALLLASSGYLQYRARNEPCPIDPELAKACRTARRWSIWILVLSALIWGVGAFFAFLAPR